VSVPAVEESIREHGARYLERVFTPRELADCGGDAQRLAARFAAKEATLKVLRPTQGVSWLSIEVIRDPAGWVGLELGGVAAELAEEAGIVGLALSLTHEGEYAAAVVVAEIEPGDKRADD
jgi:holo-[acyl-carrier protein] synthase